MTDPNTDVSYVMRATQVIVSEPGKSAASVTQAPQAIVVAAGVPWAIELAIANLNVYSHYVRVSDSAGGMPAAIARFAAEFNPEKLQEIEEVNHVVRLGEVAPPDFFSRGGMLIWPSRQMFDVDDGHLRVVLESYLGRPGTFWIDTNTWKVARTDFGDQTTSPRK